MVSASVGRRKCRAWASGGVRQAKMTAAEKAMGRKLKRAALPGIVLSIAGLFSAMMRETKAVFYLWQKPHRMDGSVLEAVTGPLPHTPLDRAVRDALAALGHVKNNAAHPSVLEARPA